MSRKKNTIMEFILKYISKLRIDRNKEKIHDTLPVD